jgi:hypothetical protein
MGVGHGIPRTNSIHQAVAGMQAAGYGWLHKRLRCRVPFVLSIRDQSMTVATDPAGLERLEHLTGHLIDAERPQ